MPILLNPQVKFRASEEGIFAAPICPVTFTLEYGTVDHPYFIHMLAAVLISFCFFITALWMHSVYWRSQGSSSNNSNPCGDHVRERDWLTIFLIGLLLYQNPFYCFSQWDGGKVHTPICIACYEGRPL